MIPPARRPWRARIVVAVAIVAAVGLDACSSDGGDEVDVDPAVETTVVPPDPNGVGGGVPVDNLQPDVADDGFQNNTDVDGDGSPEP